MMWTKPEAYPEVECIERRHLPVPAPGFGPGLALAPAPPARKQKQLRVAEEEVRMIRLFNEQFVRAEQMTAQGGAMGLYTPLDASFDPLAFVNEYTMHIASTLLPHF